MQRIKKSILIITIVIAASFTGAVILANSGSGERQATGGKLVVEPASYDWGEIGLQPANATLTVKNDGTAAVKITKLSTSCGCTSAALSIAGRTTARYSMDHGNLAPVNVSLQPGESGQLLVTFDPLFHENTQGPVERVVYLRTDNPGQPEVEATLTANVVR